MIGSFTEVQPLYYWVQHILPLVYDDSLSYMELLGRITKKLNELVENNKLLPDYIMELIKEYISSGEIEKVLAEVLANYMLNVKFPPKGLTPAVGDGSADDTAAIQGCIDYAYQNGGMAVYFPSGSYLTQPLTLNEKVTLFGQDRYTTRLVMKGGATQPMFTGTVDEMTLSGLGFDGNMDIQVNNVNLFTITVNSAVITNVLMTDGYDLLNITVNKELQLDNVLFRHAVENGLVVSGAGYVQANNLIFKSLSTLIGKNYVVLNTNDSLINALKCDGAAPNGILITGNHNVVNMWKGGTVTPYVNNGVNNSIHVYDDSELINMTGDAEYHIGGSFLRSVIGDYNLTVAGNVIKAYSKNLIETTGDTRTNNVTGAYNETVNISKKLTTPSYVEEVANKTVNSSNITEKATTKRSVTALNAEESYGTATETVTGTKTNNYGDYVETINGNKTVTAPNLTENVSGDYTINGGDMSETLDNKTIHTKQNLSLNVEGISDEIVTGSKQITAPNMDLNLNEPLKYRNTDLGEFFNSLKFKDRNLQDVNVLVDNGNARLLQFRNSDRLNGKTIVMLGDSNGKGEGWPGSDGVFTVMREMYPNANWINYSVSGAPFVETSDIALIKQYETMVSAGVKPDYIILFSGNNDIVLQDNARSTNVIGYHTSYLPYWYDVSRLNRTTSVGSLAYLINTIKTNYPECAITAVKRTNSHTHIDNIYKWAWDEFYYTFVKYGVPLMDFNTIFNADPIIPAVKSTYWTDDSHYNEKAFRELVAPAIDSLLFNLEGNYVPFNALCVPYSTDNETEAFEFLRNNISDRLGYDGYIYFMANNNTRAVKLTNFSPTSGGDMQFFTAIVNQANIFESKMYLSNSKNLPVSLNRFYLKNSITNGDLGLITTSGIYSFLTGDLPNITQLPPDFPTSGGIMINLNLLNNGDDQHTEIKIIFPVNSQGIFYVGYQLLTNTISWFKYTPNQGG